MSSGGGNTNTSFHNFAHRDREEKRVSFHLISFSVQERLVSVELMWVCQGNN